MNQINLLPKEERKTQGVTDLKRKLEIILILLVAVFVISVSSAFGATLYLNNKLKGLVSEKDKLEAEVKSLSQAETKTIYLRNRVEKYNLIKTENNEIDAFTTFENLAKDFPADSEFGQLIITSSSISFEIKIRSLESLAYMIDLILKSDKYDHVFINNLIIQDKDFRYVLVLSLNTKQV